MLYVVTLYSVAAEAADSFVASLHRDAGWQTLARRIAPELIATDILRHLPDSNAPLFICFDFWATTEAYLRACRSPLLQALFATRRQLADSAFEIGAFAFPNLPDPPQPARRDRA